MFATRPGPRGLTLRTAFLAIAFTLTAPGFTLAQSDYAVRFSRHSYNVSAGGYGGYNDTNQPNVTIPFQINHREGESYTGNLELRFPEALADGRPEGPTTYEYLTLQSPSTVSATLVFDWKSPVSTRPDEKWSYYMDVEISSYKGSDETNGCKVRVPMADVPAGTTKHFEQEFSCTFPKVLTQFDDSRRMSGLASIHTVIYFTTYTSCGICGFLSSVYTSYAVTAPNDLQVRRIVVTQPVQDDNNTYPVVAGKNTVARVFVKTAQDNPANPPIPGVKATLRGFRGGAELAGSPIRAQNEPISAPAVPNSNNTDDSLNFLLPTEWTRSPGALTLRAEVNPDGSIPEPDRTNNTLETTVTVQPSYPLNVQWIRVCIPDPAFPGGLHCPGNEIAVNTGLLQKWYPIAEDGLQYDRFWRPTWTWKAPLAKQPIKTQLNKLYELTDLGSPPDQLFAWFPEVAGIPSGSSDPLFAGGTSRVAFGQDTSADDDADIQTGEGDGAHTLAHEMAHNFGLRHINNADADSWDPGTDWPAAYGNGRIQNSGFDAGEMVAIPSWRYDLMAYRSPQAWNMWISGFHYQKLVNSQLQPALKRADGAAVIPFMLISGMARRDGSSGALDPLYRLTASFTPRTSNPAGNHCVQLLGASGKLSDFCFDLKFLDDLDGKQTETQSFVVSVPYTEGTTAVVLKRGESELARRAASTSPPAVAITSPAAGASWTATQTISWTASDPDGDPLTYALLYSPDGGTKWIPIDTDLTETQFTVNTAELSAGSSVLFRVAASDGFHTTQATSGAMTVVAAPIVELEPRLDFGAVKLGASADRKLLLSNRGSKTVRISAATSALPDFALVDAVPFDLAPGASRLLAIRFTPQAEGARASALTLTTDDPAHPVVVAQLFGSAAADPQIELSPTGVSFGNVAIGDAVGGMLTIRNKGRGNLVVNAVTTNNSQFSATLSPLPAVIAAGSETKLTVGFRPAYPVAHTATLAISTNLASSPTTAILYGVGIEGTAASCYQSLYPTMLSKSADGGDLTVTVTSPDGCTWPVNTDADWLVLSTAQGTGSRSISILVRPNSGAPRTTTVRIGDAALNLTQEGPGAKSIVPAVASSPGALGSYFRTGVQLHNPSAAPISGTLTFHPASASGMPTDASMSYSLLAGETTYFEDLLPRMRKSGIGSLDVRPTTGSYPASTFRIFNDAGAAGTTGMTEEQMDPGDALEQGETGVLIAPPEPSRARFNIGVRSLDFGAALEITIRNSTGAVRTTLTKVLPPTYFAQQKAEDFLGLALLASDTVSFRVGSGSAIVYGAANDNVTQDPSLQFARAIAATSESRRVIPVVASIRGAGDSLFRTALQLHNPGSAAMSGRLRFHPLGYGGSDNDPAIDYALQPGATASWDDILAAFSRNGMGSLDVVPAEGGFPVSVARIFNDAGANGTSGFAEEQLGAAQALQPGETGVLLAPPDPTQRFNIGLRTLRDGAVVTITVRDRSGAVTKTITKTYGGDYFEQQNATAVLGIAPGANASIAFHVESGSLIAYGASIDNITQDSSMQLARAAR